MVAVEEVAASSVDPVCVEDVDGVSVMLYDDVVEFCAKGTELAGIVQWIITKTGRSPILHTQAVGFDHVKTRHVYVLGERRRKWSWWRATASNG